MPILLPEPVLFSLLFCRYWIQSIKTRRVSGLDPRVRTSENALGLMDFFSIYCTLLVLMSMLSEHVASATHLSIPERGISHLWLSIRCFLCIWRSFFLTWFEGLRTENVTIVLLVNPSKENIVILGSNYNKLKLKIWISLKQQEQKFVVSLLQMVSLYLPDSVWNHSWLLQTRTSA